MTRGARPRRDRLGTGELEAQVLDVLWDEGGWLTPGQVNERLATGRDLAYTTIMTILVRLVEKGIVARERHGRSWAYRPLLGREEQAAQRMNDVLRHGGNPSVSLARFVDNMTAKERSELRRLLQPRRAR